MRGTLQFQVAQALNAQASTLLQGLLKSIDWADFKNRKGRIEGLQEASAIMTETIESALGEDEDDDGEGEDEL